MASVGSKGNSYDKPLAEAFNSLVVSLIPAAAETAGGTEELARASRPAVCLHSARNGTEFPCVRAVSLEAHP